MASLFSTEPVITFAFLTGVIALALTGTLLLVFLFVRLWLLVLQKQRQRTLQRWRPLMMSCLYEQAEALPLLSGFDLPHVLELWNHLHDSLGYEARNSLKWLAGQARIPLAVNQMLGEKNFHACTLAARAAGNLQLASAWDSLRVLLASDSPALSLAAARALTQIDAARAMPLLMPHLIGCNDWHPGEVIDILHIAGAMQAADPLLHAIPTAPKEKTHQLIRYLANIAPEAAAPLISHILAKSTDDDHLLNTCLDLLDKPEELEKVRVLAHHANWHVRVHAAKALGRLGAREDEVLLVSMLGDSQWWVRYRAAQALSRLPGMNSGELLHIKDTQTDRDARDMLHQVMAEQELREACMVAKHG